MSSIADFSVVLSGADSKMRQAAASLIDKALRKRGFNNIDVVNNHGEVMKLPEYVPSALESIRYSSPKLFDAFVTIQEVKVRTYDTMFEEEYRPMTRSNLN